jgi:hypothetical protein
MPKPKSKTQKEVPSGKGIEQLLADQASVILEAVDERFAAQDRRIDEKFVAVDRRFAAMDRKIDHLGQKFDNKFDTVITKLDAVMSELQAHREEDVTGARQLHRHDDQLLNHDKRIAALERRS